MPVTRIKDGQAEFGRPHLNTPTAQMKTDEVGSSLPMPFQLGSCRATNKITFYVFEVVPVLCTQPYLWV